MKPLALTILAVLLLAGCSSPSSDDVAADDTPPPIQRPGVQMPTNVFTEEFPSAAGRSLMIDRYAPDATLNLHRGVILIHGGGWIGGSRSEMAQIAGALNKKGFTAFSIDYTLAREKLWPAQLEDAQAAVRFVRSKAKEFGVDPHWIGAAGVSAGGHLSMFLGYTDAPKDGVSSRVQAVCSISGIHDLNLPLTPQGDGYRIIEQLLGEHGKPNRELRKKASPIGVATRASSPTLFVQGKVDPLVPASQSDEAAATLKKFGVETKVILVDGMGHGIRVGPKPEDEAIDQIATWFKAHLHAK